jgi:hypothetical protein
MCYVIGSLNLIQLMIVKHDNVLAAQSRGLRAFLVINTKMSANISPLISKATNYHANHKLRKFVINMSCKRCGC